MTDENKPDEVREPTPLLIEKEMKESYLTYALSVIHSRALPDVRDGLKPSQRRILVAMHDLNLGPRSKHRKCAKICGDTSGNYHPHGESVVYPTLVRMGQDFNSRYVLVDKQGNFGSNRPDNPAAMRYTEARLSHASMHMLEDIDKETVDFARNYDDSRDEPLVLPGRFPNLLCNGSSGIAVGMATSLPPHNLGEVGAALEALLEDPEISGEKLLQLCPGPDFPTGGTIMGRSGIAQAYLTGRGLITVRAKYHIEEKAKRRSLVFTEIPYQVTVAAIVESIVEAVKNGKIETISDVNNETNARTGMRLVVELKKSVEDETVTLNQLFKFTPLQSTFSIINLALDRGQPKTMTFKELLEAYRDHRVDVITRRTRYLLRKAEERKHILEGLRIALANIDEVVEIIKSSRSVDDARERLMSRFELSEIQARHVLDMRLARLTSLEIEKLEAEYNELLEEIRGYEAMLADVRLIHDVIRTQMQEMVAQYGDARRTTIDEEEIGRSIDIEALIEEERMAVTVSHQGYIKRVALENYRSQGRGGKGIIAGDIKDEDFLERLFIASTKDYLLFFTNQGRAYWRKVYQLPEMNRAARGRALVNIIPLAEDERVQEILCVDVFDDRYLLFATEQGYVKKTVLAAYSRPRENGIRAVQLDEGDRLIGVRLLRDHQSVVLGTAAGQAIHFDETEARPMGRVARGVRGIRLKGNDVVVSLAVADEGMSILTVCKNGYGKRTALDEYRQQGRGGSGIINIKTSERNGPVVAVLSVETNDEVMLTTTGGMVVRSPVSGISEIGRATQGVRFIKLSDGDEVASCARVPSEDEDDEGTAQGTGDRVAPEKSED
ncbi:MAG: DNA gyrase subunit A [Planctomycetes bacterium]|nr:DNA gyrase subunit A [Planctomycetota bacterium]